MKTKTVYIVAALVVFVLMAAAALLVIILPGQRLNHAAALLENDQPAQALEELTALAESPLSQLPFSPAHRAADMIPEARKAWADSLLGDGQFAQAAGLYASLDQEDAAAYCLGMEKMNAEAWEEAAEYFKQAADFRDARGLFASCNEMLITALLAETAEKTASDVETAKEPEATAEIHAAQETIVWGRYEQDNDLVNGPEPILWRVLEKKGDYALLITDQVLDCQCYANGFYVVSWETSGLRDWLNLDFLKTAFTEEERTLLRTRAETEEAEASPFPVFDPTDGDLITLLDRSLLSRYFPDHRLAEMTPYAMERGAKNGYWWLGTEDYESDEAAYCGSDSGAAKTAYVNENGIGVRPVVWLSLSAFQAFGAQSDSFLEQ